MGGWVYGRLYVGDIVYKERVLAVLVLCARLDPCGGGRGVKWRRIQLLLSLVFQLSST
jgi:hypothetical protein